MKTSTKWLPIAVSLGLSWACLPAVVLAGHSAAAQTSAQTSHKKTKKHHSKRTPVPKAPTADRISEIQSALSRGGYYQGDPSGKWDSNTVAAVQKFQSANGIEATGKLDAPTLQKLGLGSDIAGVSAPKPVVPNSAPMSTPPSAPGQPQTSVPSASSVTASNTTSSSPSSSSVSSH